MYIVHVVVGQIYKLIKKYICVFLRKYMYVNRILKTRLVQERSLLLLNLKLSIISSM